MVTLEGLFTSRRVPPGVLKATGYFQATMGDVLGGYIDKICLLWADDIVIWGETPEVLLKRLLEILDRLLERRIFAAAHKSVFFRNEIKWHGKILSRQAVSYDPERTQGLSELRRPETAGELMQFLQAINWMRTFLPELAEFKAPLRALLQECAIHGAPSACRRAVLLAATSGLTNARPRGMLCDYGCSRRCL